MGRDSFSLASELAVGSDCCGSGCGCADRWDCPLWCWLKLLGSLALVVEVLASVALTVDAGPGDAGCGCVDRWDCPLWCWLRWLGSLALVVEVLASAALTVDAGPVDAG